MKDNREKKWNFTLLKSVMISKMATLLRGFIIWYHCIKNAVIIQMFMTELNFTFCGVHVFNSTKFNVNKDLYLPCNSVTGDGTITCIIASFNTFTQIKLVLILVIIITNTDQM